MLDRKNKGNNLRITLAANIKFYREKSGLSEEELSLRIGRNKDYIKKLEALQFKSNPPIYVVESISKELCVSFELLLGYEKKD